MGVARYTCAVEHYKAMFQGAPLLYAGKKTLTISEYYAYQCYYNVQLLVMLDGQYFLI